MNTYPRDEFDDVPEDSERRGAYRGVVHNPHSSQRGFMGILIFGALALLVGAVMFIYQPKTLAPDSTGSSANSSAEASASANSHETKDPAELTVEVYNGGAYAGAAAQVEQSLTEKGYTVSATANWQGAAVATSIIYYSNGNVDEANALANELGIEYIEEDSETEVDIYVVLGPDYAGVSAENSSDTGSEYQDSSNQGQQEQNDTGTGAEQEIYDQPAPGAEDGIENGSVTDPYLQNPVQNLPEQ